MHLSKFEFNSARRGARQLLASPQALHAAVESSFPQPTSGQSERSRVLWRVDPGEHHPILFVVSPRPPDFTHLVEQAGWPTQPAWGTADYSAFLESLEPGQQWQFRLAANPVRNEPRPDGQRGKRFAHVTVQQQSAWLAQRAPSLGVSVDHGPAALAKGMQPQPRSEPDEFDVDMVSFAVSDRRLVSFRRNRRTVTIRRVQFDGTLRVADPDRFRTALTSGIGPAKAYGCGLMTLAPVAGAPDADGGR